MSEVVLNTTEVTGGEAPARTPEQLAADAAALARAGATDPAPKTTAEVEAEAAAAALTGDAKALADTKAELTRTQQELAKLKKPNEPAAKDPKDPASQDDAAQKIVDNAGLDVTPWQTEFNETRDVSEEGRAKIAEGLKGILGENARSVVDDYIEGQRMRVENYETQVYDMAGGKEQYVELIKWAGTNLKPGEIEAFNRAADSKELNTTRMAVEGLKARYAKENGSAPKLITGENAIPNSNVGFNSAFEMTQAMSDPRYKTDPVYRKSVEQRTQLSKF